MGKAQRRRKELEGGGHVIQVRAKCVQKALNHAHFSLSRGPCLKQQRSYNGKRSRAADTYSRKYT